MMFKELLSQEKLVQFVSDTPVVSAMSVSDASGNDMWSVNVVIGTEDGLLAKDSTNLQKYDEPAI